MAADRSFMRCLALCILLCLLRPSAVASSETGEDDGEGAISKLANEIAQLKESLNQAVSEKDICSRRAADLESRLKEEQQLGTKSKADCEAKKKKHADKIAALESDLKTAEKRITVEGEMGRVKEQQVGEAYQEIHRLTEALKDAEAKLEKQKKVLAALDKELPPASNQGSADAAKLGDLLLERVRSSVKHQESLAAEVERLKGEVARQESQLREGQQAQAGRAEEEVGRLQALVGKLEAELDHAKGDMEHVSALWLPPWIALALESIQNDVEHHWTHTAAPTIKLVRSQSLEAYEYTKKSAEPHIANLLKAGRELAASTRDAVRPHLELAKERHAATVTWLGEQAKEVQKAAEPHVSAGLEALKGGLDQLHEAASPYLQQAWEVVLPYYQEAYSAAKPGVDAFLVSVGQQWRSAKESVSPHLEGLAEKTAQYQKQAVDYAVNVTHQVTGSPEATSELLLFGEFALYLAVLLAALSFAYYLLSSCMGWNKQRDLKKILKAKAGQHGKKHHPHHPHKKHHHNSHHK